MVGETVGDMVGEVDGNAVGVIVGALMAATVYDWPLTIIGDGLAASAATKAKTLLALKASSAMITFTSTAELAVATENPAANGSDEDGAAVSRTVTSSGEIFRFVAI